MRRVIALAVALTALLPGGAFSDPAPASISGDAAHGDLGLYLATSAPGDVPVVDLRSKEQPPTSRKLPAVYRQPEHDSVRGSETRGLVDRDDVVPAGPTAPPHPQRGPPAATVGPC